MSTDVGSVPDPKNNNICSSRLVVIVVVVSSTVVVACFRYRVHVSTFYSQR